MTDLSWLFLTFVSFVVGLGIGFLLCCLFDDELEPADCDGEGGCQECGGDKEYCYRAYCARGRR